MVGRAGGSAGPVVRLGAPDLEGSVSVTATLIDGRATAKAIREDLAVRVRALAARGITPGLGTVLVGDDPASVAYVAGKHRDCAGVGIASLDLRLSADSTPAQVEVAVRQLNADPACTGFLVQVPLPPQLDAGRVLELVDPAKDADGLHPVNLGRLVLGMPGVRPCTARGIEYLLLAYGVPTERADICVVGRGTTAGRPTFLLLANRLEAGTVVSCHRPTRDLASHVRAADIVVVAAGAPGLVTAGMVKPGAAVIDVGITRTAAGLIGDVAPGVADVAGWLAPVPGGVGPMTRAMLLTNVVEAAEAAAGVPTPAAAA